MNIPAVKADENLGMMVRVGEIAFYRHGFFYRAGHAFMNLPGIARPGMPDAGRGQHHMLHHMPAHG